MHTRRVAAMAAGVAGAVIAHALDAAGLLPGVHESTSVRTAMGPALTGGWLLLAAAVAWLAAATRPVPVGAAGAVVVAAVPELVGRHDLGAVVEPGAIAGALVQWLLLLLVVAAALAVERQLSRSWVEPPVRPGPPVLRHRHPASAAHPHLVRPGRPRGPPRRSPSDHPTRGTTWRPIHAVGCSQSRH